MLTTCVIEDGNKFYHQLFLEYALHVKQKQRKAIKKDISKELIPVAWHPPPWWVGACQKMRKRTDFY